MKKTLLALMLMAGSTFAQDPYSAGANPGAPGNYPPAGAYATPGQDPYPQYSTGPGAIAPGYYPPAGAYAAPVGCGPGYVWIDGYYDASGYFVNGYCAVPPFSGAYWVAPGFYGGRFIAGYWGRGGSAYAPGFGFRGGYGPNYALRGGYGEGPRAAEGSSGFRAPATAAPSFHAGGSYRSGGSAMRSAGAGHGGRR